MFVFKEGTNRGKIGRRKQTRIPYFQTVCTYYTCRLYYIKKKLGERVQLQNERCG